MANGGNGVRLKQYSTSRRRFLQATGAATTVGLAGCVGSGGDGGSSNNSSGGGGSSGNTVHFLNDRSARDVWEAAAKEFSSNSDYDVQITWLPKGTAMNEQVSKMEAAGNLPALIFETSADCYTETLNGQTVPLTDVVKDLGVRSTVKMNNESYMVPIVATPLSMIYRNDIINGNPRTWSEWQAEAKRIQNETEKNGYAVGAGRTNAAATHTYQILWNSGVNPYSGTSGSINVTLDQKVNRKRAVAAFDWLQAMNKLGPNASGWNWSDFTSALISGGLAAWAGLGGLAIQQIQANRPDLVSKFTPVPYPVAEGQDPTQWWSYFEGIYSYKGADNTKGAKEFLRFFYGSDYYFKYLRRTAPFSFPTTLEGINDKRYKNAKIYDTLPKFIDLVKNNWDSMAPVLNTGDNGAPNAIAANAYSQQLYGQAASQLLYGGRSSQETVDWLAEQLRNLQSSGS
jgi:multiple sugar transport system substrate-binding protein